MSARIKPERIARIVVGVFGTLLLAIAVTYAMLYTTGNTITSSGIISTGTAKITVLPEGEFTVFINEQKRKLSSSNTLDNLKPGDHTIRIERDGYNSWQQQISISPNLVTDVTVQLFPDKFKFEQLTTTNIKQVFFSPSRRFVYYSVVNNPIGTKLGIWRKPLSPNNLPLISETATKITNLTNNIVQAANNGQINVLPSPDDSLILLQNNDKYYILNTTTYNEPNPSSVLNLSYPINNISWLNNDNLLIESDGMLISYNITSATSIMVTYQSNQSLIYAKTPSSIIFLQNDNLFRYREGTGSPEKIKLENISLPQNITGLHASQNNDHELVLDSTEGIFYLDTNNSLLAKISKAEIISVAPSARNLLVRQNENIISYGVKISLIRNTVAIKKTVSNLSNLEKSPHNNIVWAPNSNYIVFGNKQQTELKIFTADHTGNNIVEILNLQNSSIDKIDYDVLSDNSGLVIKLVDSQVLNNNTTRSNLYKLSY